MLQCHRVILQGGVQISLSWIAGIARLGKQSQIGKIQLSYQITPVRKNRNCSTLATTGIHQRRNKQKQAYEKKEKK
jgi:hypothetical protein